MRIENLIYYFLTIDDCTSTQAWRPMTRQFFHSKHGGRNTTIPRRILFI